MHRVQADDVRAWLREGSEDLMRGMGASRPGSEYLEEMGLPLHLQFVARRLREEGREDALESIPFFSLCKGVLLPLCRMQPGKAAQLFAFAADEPPGTQGREELLAKFFEKEIGIGLVHKLGCVLGDPFLGRTSTFKRDSLMRLLGSITLQPNRALLDQLAAVGDVGILFARARPKLHEEPKLTAAEVLLTLEFLPDAPRNMKFELLRGLLLRAGKMEAYFIARLILRSADYGFEYEGALVARTLGEHFGAEPEAVAHAIALSDTFHVAKTLAAKGEEGLREVRLRPLVAIRPALASGSTEDVKQYPVWVERKYDGIRFMLHKSTGRGGSVLCAAYTRGRRDWLDLVPGLDNLIRTLPCRDAIVDGELHGIVVDERGSRPASVYEVYAALQGERGAKPVRMRYAAFDLLYKDGVDLTAQPLRERRQLLQALVGPLSAFPAAVPVSVAEGQLAEDARDVKRLYEHFRRQGYEGVITKDLEGAYALARRDRTWLKRKPAVTLDLALIGGIFTISKKENVGLFGSFVLGARTEGGGFLDVGDVQGLDRHTDAQIQADIARNGLITGKRIERQSASGLRPGVELRPHLVGTIKFEGVLKDDVSGELRLRGPKLVAMRSDKHPGEANTVQNIEQLWLRQRMG